MRLPSKLATLLVLLVLSLSFILAGTYAIWSPGHVAAFDRIERGWTYGQVVDEFGVEPGDYADRWSRQESSNNLDGLREALRESQLASLTWCFDDGQVDILFDKNETVVSKLWLGRPPPSIWDRLRRLVGL
jgi:hypothetical protein